MHRHYLKRLAYASLLSMAILYVVIIVNLKKMEQIREV